MNIHFITLHAIDGHTRTRYYRSEAEANKYVKTHEIFMEMFPTITHMTRGCVEVSVSEYYSLLGIDPLTRDVRLVV